MELVTWVMEELKSKQEIVRHSKTSNSRKQPTTPRLKGPREEVIEAGPWGQGHPEVPQPGGPQRGEEHWFLLPPSGQTQAEPGNIACRSQKQQGRTRNGREDKRTSALTRSVPDTILNS